MPTLPMEYDLSDYLEGEIRRIIQGLSLLVSQFPTREMPIFVDTRNGLVSTNLPSRHVLRIIRATLLDAAFASATDALNVEQAAAEAPMEEAADDVTTEELSFNFSVRIVDKGAKPEERKVVVENIIRAMLSDLNRTWPAAKATTVPIMKFQSSAQVTPEAAEGPGQQEEQEPESNFYKVTIKSRLFDSAFEEYVIASSAENALSAIKTGLAGPADLFVQQITCTIGD